MIPTIAIAVGARCAWGLPPRLPAGAVVIGLTGERLRVLQDGTVEEVLEVPRRWSASADPCNARRAA